MLLSLARRLLAKSGTIRTRRPAHARLSLTALEARETPASLYNLTWLGTAAAVDNYSTASAISDAGQVVGTSGVQHPGMTNGMQAAVGPYQAFSWTAAGGMVGLGTLNGSESYADDVNASGQIVGTYNYYTIPYQVNGGGYYEWAWSYKNGQMSTIPGHDQIGGHSRAHGVNDAGVVVGVSDPTGLAFKYDGTTFTTLGTLGGQFSQGWDINNSGWVAGIADTGANPATQPGVYRSYYHAVVWSPDGVIHDLGTLGSESYATKMNDGGSVVGYSVVFDQSLGYSRNHPFISNGVTMTDIGIGLAADGYALSVNNLGQVVGSGASAANNAWLYDGGIVYDLSTLVVGGVGSDALAGANDINNLGQIVGVGTHNGHTEAFLLTPTSALTPTVNVTGGPFTYDGAPHQATATAIGTGGVAVSGSFTFTYNGSPTPPTNAGTYQVVATFTSSDPSYGNATGTGNLTINSAAPTVSVTGGRFAYDGAAHPATGSATGVGGVSVGGTFTFTYNGSASVPTTPGTYAVVGTFASADPNYTGGTGTATITVIPPSAPPGVGVGSNVNITRTTGNHHESSVSIDPTNPNRMFAASLVDGVGIYVSTSADGGATWANRTVSYPPGAGAVQTAWDGYGNLYLCYLSYSRSTPSSYVALLTSADGGATFTVLPPVSNTFARMPSLAVGAGSVWVAHIDSRTNSIIAAGAPVAGLGQVGAFTSSLLPGSWGGSDPSVVVGPSGQVMVGYQYGGLNPTGPDTIVVNLNPTGLGGTFGSPVAVTTTQVGGLDRQVPAQSNTAGIDAEVGLAWDHSGGVHTGRVYLVYTDAPSIYSSATDIYLRYSDDSGATWTAAVPVTDAVGGSKFMPSVAVDQSTGAVGISWYDTRFDTGNRGAGDTNGVANDDAQLWAAFSRDGGATFLPNVQVSTGTSNSAAAHGGTALFRDMGYGDYSRSDFVGGHYFRVWADNSNSTGDNPDGALHAFDVYTANVTLTASRISANGVDVRATTGAPFTGVVATFANVDAAHTAASYDAVITWGDGTSSVGVISGSGATLSVTGTHTYAAPGTSVVHATVRDLTGVAASATTTSTATVTTQGVAAGETKEANYWKSTAGQSLITSFNGGATHTELSAWLATNFVNLYGAGGGSNNLTGKTNAQVAAYFLQLWQTVGDGAATQVLATALNVYATTRSLGGVQGATAGFEVSDTGHGARSFNVRGYGAAVGVANNTSLTVFQMLKAVDALAIGGLFYGGNSALLGQSKKLFDALNTI